MTLIKNSLILSLMCFVFSAHAAIPVPAAPKLSAKSFLLIDINSDTVLAQKKIDRSIEPASITKMMTAYVVYKELEIGRISLDEMVPISEKAWRMKGSKMFVEVGSKVRLGDLLMGLIVQSGNDASVALAEHIAGTEVIFADYMNQYAKTLGMNKTNYVNSTGWPHHRHKTTARDIAVLAKALITEFPEHYQLYSEKSMTYNGIKQYNRNKLLWRDKSIDGIKTGHTDSAGYCLVASAKRGDMRLISVILGTRSNKARTDQSQKLLNYGFRFYESHALYVAGEGLKDVRIWEGEKENLALGLKQDLTVTIPRGQYKKLEASMEIDQTIIAPVKKGQEMGSVHVKLNGDEIISMPLVALNTIEKGGLLQRAKDKIILMFD
ncbi:MAG: D-alanyl-D-alanine carboxypeptidase [Gammaproteobacteria bacterium]|nr:D-alanyl-D-alanine carboxypeptidase [Gammaproteobacteria bacterium]